ncbi:MAG: DMT family transporter [Pleomorphochaeta sp.]
MNNSKTTNRILLCFCMLLWGSLGLFTRNINLSGIELAFSRAFFSIPILFIFRKIKNNKRSKIPKKIFLYYLFSGALIGCAWTGLFNAYEYTTISNAVLIYNMCPVYVIILSHFLLNEKITVTKIITILGCFGGLILLINNEIDLTSISASGVTWALFSGMIYAIIVIMNKKANSFNIKIDSITITLIQFLGATIILLPSQLLNNSFTHIINLNSKEISLLIILIVLHTAFTYIIYFEMYKRLSAIEIVSFSYLEPLFAIFLSILVLRESMYTNQILGGLLILGFTFYGEFYKSNKKNQLSFSEK